MAVPTAETGPVETSAAAPPLQPSSMSESTTPCASLASPDTKWERDAEKSGEEGAPSVDQAPPSPASGRPIRGIRWFLVCAALYIISFLYGLDTTIAADIQGPVIEAFGRIDQLAWIGAGFPLGSVAVQLLNGNLYAHFDLKWIFIGGVVMFEIGSAICGAAPNMDALIVGRVLAGAGGSAIYIGNLNYFTLLTTPKERGLYISLIGLFWCVGAVIGPVIGGAFAESAATWRWAFYINLVLGAVAAPIYLLYLPSLHFTPTNRPSPHHRLKQFDFLGLTLIAATWILFTTAFTTGLPWSHPTTIALLTLFSLFTLASITQQSLSLLTTPPNRAFPVHLLVHHHSRTQILLFIATACASSALFVTTYYIPLYFQFVRSDSAMQAAVRLLPFIAVAGGLSVAAGHLLSRIKYYMPLYLVGGVFVAVGGGLLVWALGRGEVGEVNEGMVYGFTVVVAVGTGLTVTVGYTVATLTVGEGEAGGAVTLQNVSQLGSTVICLVVAGQVFQSEVVRRLGEVLAGQGFGEQEIREAAAGAQSELFKSLTGEMRTAAIGAIVQAMQRVFVLVVVAGGVMVVAAAGMKRERLRFSEVVAAM